MATVKFAGPSPYSLKATYPPEDYLHTEYLNFSTRNQGPKPEAPPVVAALFGLGKAGSIHLSNIVGNSRIILKYIIDDRPEIFDDIRQYWNLRKDVVLITSADANRVYEDKSVNIVLIASPTWTHGEIVVKSIASNKDVFCEKPITESIEKTTQCYEAAKARGRKLYTAFNRRFDPAYRALKERVRKGEVGHVQILKSVARDSPVPSIDYLKVSGMIKVENMRPSHSTEAYIGQAGVKLTPIFHCFPSRFKLAYKYELEHFLDAVQYDVPMDVTSWQSFAVHKISAATAEAARTGRAVEIDWSQDNMPPVYS